MSNLTQLNQFSLAPQDFDQLMQFADIVSKSGMVPKDYIGKPGNVVVAVQMGLELGLQPIQSLQNISVINGRPSLWGDALPAIVYASGLCEYIKEFFSEDGKVATCEVKRKNRPVVKQIFSLEDAKTANLLGKDNWKHYPKRMIQRRARNFALADAFPDVLKGMQISEDMEDFNYAQEQKTTAAPQTVEQLGLSTIKKDGKLIVEGKTFGKTELLKNLGFKYENKIWFMDLPAENTEVIEEEVTEVKTKEKKVEAVKKQVIESIKNKEKKIDTIKLVEIEEKLNFLGLETQRKDTDTQKWLCITSKNVKEFAEELKELGFRNYASRGIALNVTDLVKTETVVTKEEVIPVIKTTQNSLTFDTPFDDGSSSNSNSEKEVQDELPFV
jgi:hypothetical protein